MIIRKPVIKDISQLKNLFETSIKKAFENDGFGDAFEEIKEEIHMKMEKVHSYLENPASESGYLIAEIDEKIVGAISFGEIGKVTTENVSNDFLSEGELGSMYILPTHQGKGIASELISKLIKDLRNKGIRYVSFDSGYKPAQQKWRKKFGEPYKIVKNYWAEDVDLYIWLIDLNNYKGDE